MSTDKNMFSIIAKSCSDNYEFDSESLITFVNNFSYIKARENIKVYKEFDYIYCDGILMCLIMKALHGDCRRISFDMTSLAPIIFKEASESKKTIYFIGGEPGVVDDAVSVFRSEFPELIVAGCRHGYFDSVSERLEAMREILQIKPDIVVVGMGALIQEEFLVELRFLGWSGVGYTCGGFLHQTAKGGAKYYPNWINRMQLRWLYRIFDEPKLFKRYFLLYPKSIFLVFFDFFRRRHTTGER